MSQPSASIPSAVSPAVAAQPGSAPSPYGAGGTAAGASFVKAPSAQVPLAVPSLGDTSSRELAALAEAAGTLWIQGATVATQTFGDLSYHDVNGRPCFLRVLPFRPHPEHIYSAYSSVGGVHLAACAYAECDRDDKRAEALLWFANKNGRSGGGAASAAVWAFCGDRLL